MSDRFHRPRTPPSPPPSSSSRRTSARGPATSSSASSKSLPSKSYGGDRSFEKYDKSYKSSSSSYQSSKDYPDDKYKGGKLSDKVASSKYGSKSVYIDDNFKVGSYKVGSSFDYSSQSYSGKDGYSTKYSDKGRLSADEKYPLAGTGNSASNQYSSKKYDDYDTYSDKTSRYPKQESGGSYYGSSYGSFDNYSSERRSGYGSDRVAIGSYGYGDKFGGGGGGGGYAGDKVSGGSLGFGGNKLGRGGSSGSYGLDKHGKGRGGSSGGYGGDKHGGSGLSYGDNKSGANRSRLYGEDDQRLYRSSYSPSRTSRSDARGYGANYDDYNYGSSSSQASVKQYLDRYVIGDSVVYGPPGQYPRNLQSTSPGHRPPSPPSPPLMHRNYNRYSTTSPRRFSGSGRSLSPTNSAFRSLSPSGRRPLSPPIRKPPSPDSAYVRGRDRNFESRRSKERYSGKTATSRSPLRDRSGVTDRRDDSRLRADDRSSRRDSDRRLGSREKTGSLNATKRGRLEDHRSSDYHGTSNSNRNWAKDSYSSGSQSHRDDRNSHPSPSRTARRDTRTDSGSRERGRRLEDRLSINPPSGSRRSPAARPRMGRNASSPRDGSNKKPRRPDDLRLWIESRKNEGNKKGSSQTRPLNKGAAARSGDRSKLRRPRLGDPKKRLGGKGKKAGGPLRRNKILNKYRRMAAKRGMRSNAGHSSNRSNREGNRREGGGRGGNGDDADNSKPGSTASIRRVIKKPRKVSQVNNLEIRPRVMGKPVKKLLKDPKENEEGSKSRHDRDQPPSSYSSRDEGSRDDEKPAASQPQTSSSREETKGDAAGEEARAS